MCGERGWKRMRINLVEQLLSKGLMSKDSQLDLWGSDRRVLYIAYQDFMNFLKVHWELVGKEAGEVELKEKINGYFCEKPKELEEFVHLWCGIWMKKWKERVKLNLEKEDPRRWRKIDKLLSKAEPIWKQLKNRNQLKDLVIEALIRNGEICGTSILAEDMLKAELGLCIERKAYTEDRELLLGVVNNTLRKVRKISRSKGPLIFIKIDRRFFQLLEEDIR